MKLNLPKKYLSFSQLTLWSKDREAYRKRYYEGIPMPDTEYTLFGREVHTAIDTDPKFKDIRLDTAEKKIAVDIDGVPVLGYIDTFDQHTCDFGEYKSGIRKKDGKPRWTQSLVQKHEQLPFYSLLRQEKYCINSNST